LTLTAALVARDWQGVAILGGALASATGADEVGAARIVALAAPAIDTAFAPFWLLDAALRRGRPEERARAEGRLAELARHDTAHAARGLLHAAASREAVRRRRRDAAAASAREAAAAFAACGWKLDEALALEAAGNLADALAIFRAAGAEADVRRLTAGVAAPRRRGDATLTTREREVADLVLHGQSARAIAAALSISERTVATHIASIYRKLGVGNRQELARTLDPAAAER
jgi:DNA-binding NarL/FixJ family response regulator